MVPAITFLVHESFLTSRVKTVMSRKTRMRNDGPAANRLLILSGLNSCRTVPSPCGRPKELNPSISNTMGNTSIMLIIKDISKLTYKRLPEKNFISQCSDRYKNSKQKIFPNKNFPVNKFFFRVNQLFASENDFSAIHLR